VKENIFVPVMGEFFGIITAKEMAISIYPFFVYGVILN